MMKQRTLWLLPALLLVFSLCACKQSAATGDGAKAISKEALKVGLLLREPETAPESQNHINGMKAALKKLGIAESQLFIKSNIPADETAENQIKALLGEGCQVLFADSAGYEASISKLAAKRPSVQFCTATGTQGAKDDLPNTHNYYARVYEARYLSGIIAGLKTNTNKLGYVATKKDANVISGYIAFFLGAKSVNPEVQMFVNYTEGSDEKNNEADNVQELLGRGCDILSQHQGTTVPAVAAADWGRYVIGFTNDLLPVAPEATLASARVDWSVYYTYALSALLDGQAIEQDWCEGLSEHAVYLNEINPEILEPAVIDTVERVEAGLMDGSIHVFRGPLYDDNGVLLVKNGMFFDENDTASAPNWNIVIKGITLLA